jgi:hypothetical protein
VLFCPGRENRQQETGSFFKEVLLYVGWCIDVALENLYPEGKLCTKENNCLLMYRIPNQYSTVCSIPCSIIYTTVLLQLVSRVGHTRIIYYFIASLML